MSKLPKFPIINGKKECSKCHLVKSISDFSETKKGVSARCKECNNAYYAEYRKKPENKKKMAQYHKERMSNPLVRNEKNAYTREWRKRPEVSRKKLEEGRLWKRNEKKKAVDFLGGRCSVCGYNKNLAALEFHHLNPEEKETYNSHWKFERNKSELEKCICVCANCHREIHAGEVWNNA